MCQGPPKGSPREPPRGSDFDLDQLVALCRACHDRTDAPYTTDAIQDFQKVLKLEPGLVPARYQLALAQLQAGSLQQAKAELKEAIRIAPAFVEPALLLAQLNIQTGAPQPAVVAR